MATEHATKIYTVAITGIIVTVAFLALTSTGHVIDAATQHFMLFYAGVFALIALCASVGLGLVATDRMFLHPGQRVFIQAAHRAASFGAVTFLVIHITTEILAQRSHVIDAVVPFLSPFRTFYIGLGTIASDLIILLVITGIMRGRFTAHGKAWRWRAIHYTSYASLVFGVWHGLLAGRPGKPYVDWSYGFVVAFVLIGLAVRILSNSLRPKENLSTPPVDQAANSASAPLRAAAMLAQYGAVRGGNIAIGAATGGQPMLSAPVQATVLTTLPAGAAPEPAQPYYEPGYEGPPRYLGAPRATDSGPMPRVGTGPLPRADTGAMPRAATGPLLRADTGPMPRVGTGPLPRADTGPMPRSATGPMPRPATGPMPRPATGPMPMAGPGPLPPSATGAMPRTATGSMPQAATGPLPRMTGPFPAGTAAPQSWTGPMPRATGPVPQAHDGRGTGPRPMRPGSDPYRETGPQPRGRSGPAPMRDAPWQRPATGPMPRPRAGGPAPQSGHPYPGSGQDGQPSYQEWPTAGYEPGWLEASHDGERHQEQPPWEGYLPEPDPGLRYREPGPGMPGYRGSREYRHGGDRY